MKSARTAKLPPFYTQSNGTFPRPRPVVDLLSRRDEFTPERFTQVMNDLVRYCIRAFGLAGLDVVSDGEWRRPRNVEFLRRVGGFAPSRASVSPALSDTAEVVVKRMNPTGSVFKAHADFLVNNTARFTRFSIPGPLSMAVRFWHPEYSLAAYPTLKHLMDHLVEILYAEMHALVSAGVDIIQIDEPVLSYFCDPAQAAGDDADDAPVRRDWGKFAGITLSAINRIAEPAIGKAEVHLNSYHREHKPRASAAIDYKPLLQLLREAKVDCVSLAFATQGNIEDLTQLPEHLDIALGVLEVHSQTSQTADAITALARAAAKIVPPTRIALNPESGFPGEPLGPTRDEAYDRLRSLTAAAKALRATIRS